MNNDEVLKLMEEIFNPTKESLIRRFLESKIPGIEVTDESSMKKICGKRNYVVHRGKLCTPPQPVSHSDILDDHSIKIVVRNGQLFMVNKEAVRG